MSKQDQEQETKVREAKQQFEQTVAKAVLHQIGIPPKFTKAAAHQIANNTYRINIYVESEVTESGLIHTNRISDSMVVKVDDAGVPLLKLSGIYR